MSQPWYKQFWPWFLIALPASVIVAGIVTVVLFQKNAVSLVAEDYYKQGKGINQDRARLTKANELLLSGHLLVKNHQAIFTLNKGRLEHYPTLSFFFQHRTLTNKDIHQTLNPDANGRYRMTLPQPLQGPWYIEINAIDNSWALNTRRQFPMPDPILFDGTK